MNLGPFALQFSLCEVHRLSHRAKLHIGAAVSIRSHFKLTHYPAAGRAAVAPALCPAADRGDPAADVTRPLMTPISADVLPTYTFAGIENFRDFGGVPTIDGGRVRRDLLLRSAHLANATPDDLAHLQALRLELVVDLRRPTERHEAVDRHVEHLARLIDNDIGDEAESPHITFLRKGDDSEAGLDAFFTDYYRKAPFEPRHVDLFRRAFAALIQIEGAALVHCTAGKDRTGMLSALILAALDVHPDDRMADYLKTNLALQTPERIARVIPTVEAVTGRKANETMVRAMLGVKAMFLDTAFHAIETEAGSVEAYLARLGFGAAERDRLKARLLVPAGSRG